MPTPYDREQKNGFVLPDQMDDEAIWDLLSVYADGEATPPEVAQVEALLHQQPALARELAFLHHTADAAHHVAEVEPPLHLRSAILAATVHRPTFVRRVGMAWERLHAAMTPQPARFALAGGVCAAGLAALLLLPQRQQNSRPIQSGVTHAPVVAVNTSARPAAPDSPVTAPPAVLPVRPPTAVVQPKSQSRPLVQNALQHTRPQPDNMMAQFTVNLDQLAVQRLLTANAVPAPVHIASVHGKASSEAKLPAVARIKTQQSASLERVASNEPSGQFSPLPKMDLAYQRGVTLAVAKNTDDTLGANIDGSHDAAPEQPAPAVTIAADNGGNHIIRVTVAQLPPDARHYVTTADIKRELDAQNLGLDRVALQGIERKQCRVTLYRNKF